MENLIPLIFFLALVIGYSCYIGLVTRLEHQRNNRQLTRGLELLLTSKKVFVQTQQHRGLTNGYLKGDHQLRLQINKVKNEINDLYRLLSDQVDWTEGKARLKELNKQWDQMDSKFEEHSANSNFDQHCDLIARILDYIDDCASHYTLYELKDPKQISVLYLWQSVLKGAENIGQLRAIGTGVAAAGKCSSVDKIRLHYLQDAITRMTPSDADNSSIASLLSTVQNEIAVDAPKISANVFFEQATLTLEASIKEFDQVIEGLRR